MALSLFDNDFFGGFGQPMSHSLVLRPSNASGELRPIPVDLHEDDSTYSITADVPGVDKKDVAVSLDRGVLRIQVERSSSREEEGAPQADGTRTHMSERSTAFQSRCLRLPKAEEAGRVTAKLEGGVLQLTVPKRDTQAERESKMVDIQ